MTDSDAGGSDSPLPSEADDEMSARMNRSSLIDIEDLGDDEDDGARRRARTTL